MGRRLIVVALASITFATCGSEPAAPLGPGPPLSQTPTPIQASGDNWSIRLDGFIGAPERSITAGGSLILVPTYGMGAPLLALEGALNVTAGSVTAVLQPFGTCFSWDTNRIRFTGTRSGDTLELESQPNEGQVVRMSFGLSDGDSVAQGSYSISGGCGQGTSGSLDGRRVDPTGLWTGMLNNFPTTLDMRMADAPDRDGNFNISGTVAFSGTPCFVNASVTRRFRGRVGFPDIASAAHSMELIAEVWEDLSSMQIGFALTMGTCPELRSGTGLLVRH